MKKVNLFLVTILAIVILSACTPNQTESIAIENQPSMFVEIEKTGSWRIVYHKDTKVMYSVSYGGGYSYGVFTLLVNPDGTPMTYNKGD